MNNKINRTKPNYLLLVTILVLLLLSCDLGRLLDSAFGTDDGDPMDEAIRQLYEADKTREAELPIPTVLESGDMEPAANFAQSSDSGNNPSTGANCAPSNDLIFQGDIRNDDCNKPSLIVVANTAHTAAPDWVKIAYGGSTGISVGAGMALFQEGDWIKASTSKSVSLVGVQFFSDYAGWARIIVNDSEIWRGNLLDYRIDSLDQMAVYFRIPIDPPAPVTIYIEDLGKQSSTNKYWIPIYFFGFETP